MIWMWIGFIVLVLFLLALDLGVLNRKDHVIGVREALLWSGMWISLAMLFNLFIYFAYQHHWLGLGARPTFGYPHGMNGHEAAVLFFLGYVIEKSLSVDNIFVIALIFGYFGIPAKYQHRVLFWGILGALVMRGTMIGLGAALIERFEWIIYVFGAFLIFTAYKMIASKGESNPGNNPLVRWAQRIFPITHEYHGHAFIIPGHAIGQGEVVSHHFTSPHAGHDATDTSQQTAEKPSKLAKASWALTPLALALLVIEATDVIFAVDSIPAIFGITTDPFIVFTSNVFAILGLRALYFALAGIMDKFRYLKPALAAILGLVGIKMLLKDVLHHIPGLPFYTLGLIVIILTVAIIASVVAARRDQESTAIQETPAAS